VPRSPGLELAREVILLGMGTVIGLYELLFDHPLRWGMLLFAGSCLGIHMATSKQ